MGNCIGGTNGSGSARRHHDQGSTTATTSARSEESASVAFGVDAALSGLRAREQRINGLLGPRTNEFLTSPGRRELESLRTELRLSAGTLTALQQTLNRQNSQRMGLGDDPVGAVRVLTERSEQLGATADSVIQRNEDAIDDWQTLQGLAGDHPSMRFPNPQGR